MVRIFLSHNSKYIDLAASLKNSLHALEIKPSTQLDVRISEEMEGATNWRQWIEDNVRSADIFLLLYPHASMDMSWCNYELGRFYDGKRKIVCIKNTDIANAPPPFQPYQAYDGDEAGIGKFIDELFVKGTFTDNKPLNPKVGLPTEETYGLAQNVARQLRRNSRKRGSGNSFTNGGSSFRSATTRPASSTPRPRRSRATPMACSSLDSATRRAFRGPRSGVRSGTTRIGHRCWSARSRR